jgi:hypothetical protein
VKPSEKAISKSVPKLGASTTPVGKTMRVAMEGPSRPGAAPRSATLYSANNGPISAREPSDFYGGIHRKGKLIE